MGREWTPTVVGFSFSRERFLYTAGWANASEKMAAVRGVQGRDRAAGGGVTISPGCARPARLGSIIQVTVSNTEVELAGCFHVYKFTRFWDKPIRPTVISTSQKRVKVPPPQSRLTCGCSGSETQAAAGAKSPELAPLHQAAPCWLSLWDRPACAHPTPQENSLVCGTLFLTNCKVRLSFWRCPSDMRRMFRNTWEGYSKLKYRSVFQKSVFPMVGVADWRKWSKIIYFFWGVFTTNCNHLLKHTP